MLADEATRSQSRTDGEVGQTNVQNFDVIMRRNKAGVLLGMFLEIEVGLKVRDFLDIYKMLICSGLDLDI